MGLTLLIAGCFPEDPGERALPIAVIDTATNQIVDRIDAPLLTHDIAFDDATGSLWAISESERKPPRVWEISPNGKARRRYTLSMDFSGLGKLHEMDYGAIALDRVARRGAFTSPRSSELVLIDIDSGDAIRKITSEYLPHGTVFDTQRGIGYATSASLPYAFRTEDGEILADYFCTDTFGGPPIAISTTGLVYAPIGISTATDPWGDYVCVFHPDSGATSIELECDSAGCWPASTLVSPDGRRLFIAMPRVGRIHVVDLETSWQYAAYDASGPHGLEISPDGTRLYASKIACNRVSVFDPRPTTPVHLFDIELDGEPMGMSLSADGSLLFVSQVDPEGELGHGWEFLEEWHVTPDCPPLVPPP